MYVATAETIFALEMTKIILYDVNVLLMDTILAILSALNTGVDDGRETENGIKIELMR